VRPRRADELKEATKDDLLEVVQHVHLLVFGRRRLLSLDELLGHQRLDDLGHLLHAEVAARAQVADPDACCDCKKLRTQETQRKRCLNLPMFNSFSTSW
jgi:hypothetical protein